MGLSKVSIRPTTRVHGLGLWLIVDGVMVVSASEALWSQLARPCGLDNGGLGNGGLGQQDVEKTPLVIGTMLGITRFLNGSPSFNEAAIMSGIDSIQRRHGARSCGVCQGFVRELSNVTTSKGL